MINGAYPPPPPGDNVFTSGPSGKSRGVAGLFALLLGGFGVQYFYVGKIPAGLIALGLTLVSCGVIEILWIIQGIMLLTMSQEQFERQFVNNPSVFFLW